MEPVRDVHRLQHANRLLPSCISGSKMPRAKIVSQLAAAPWFSIKGQRVRSYPYRHSRSSQPSTSFAKTRVFCQDQAMSEITARIRFELPAALHLLFLNYTRVLTARALEGGSGPR